MKAFVTVGVSCSGKTTWAEARLAQFPNTIVACRDDIRWQLMEQRGLIPCWANWKWKDEKIVSKLQDEMIEIAASNGKDVVIADTNLNADRRAQMVQRLQDRGFDVTVKVFDEVTLEEALRRDAARAHGVGAHVIHAQWVQFIEQYGKDRYEPDPQGIEAVIIDIDGTAAIMHDRSPYDWSKVRGDKVNRLVQMMLRGFHESGMRLIFVSGRDGVCAEETHDWIREELIPGVPFLLHMRGQGDQRKDTIVKREIFDMFIRDTYDVIGVLDDRPSVARMWRDLGLNVVQFGNPYVEF